ncbi:MAG: SH3 domain-containing protein [Candidatus Limnocylindrales bacterium]
MIDIGNPLLPARAGATVARRSELIRSLVVALMLVAMAIVPASAGSGPTRLSDGAVSANSGTTSDVIVFTVAYRNREGSPADWVRVSVGGDSHAMTQSGGTDWKQQVWFTWSGTLPAGTHGVTFAAMSRDRFDDSLDAGTVTITLPPPPPPTAAPTAPPTSAPTAPPTSAPTARPSTPTATPTPAASARPSPAATPRAASTPSPTKAARTAAPTDAAAASATPGTSTGTSSPLPAFLGSSAPPAAGAVPSPTASDELIAGVLPGDAPGDDPSGGTGADPSVPGADPRTLGGHPGESAGDPVGALASALGTLGLGRPQLPLGLLLTMTTTTGVIGGALAFSVFGKRRRDGAQPAPDDVLAEAAASGIAVAAMASLGAGVFGGAPAPTPMDLELAMPRWRRPSLIEARKADPIRDATVSARLTFDHGLVGPLDGRERRLIRYSVVRLLDRPDELRGSEIGFLDSGDEVQLMEKRGVYWLVLCPDGREGWIHKMTLGEESGDSAPQASPTATMPIDADSWTMGEEADGDVLAAYIESRRRT